MPFIVTDVCQFAIIVWSLLCALYNICFVLYAFCLVLFAFLFGCSIAIVRLMLVAFARRCESRIASNVSFLCWKSGGDPNNRTAICYSPVGPTNAVAPTVVPSTSVVNTPNFPALQQ